MRKVEDYTDYVYLCENCGSVEWEEICEKGIKISLNKEGVTEFISEEWKDSDTYRYCAECGSGEVYYLPYDEVDNEEFKKIAKMTSNERIEWLKKYKIITKLGENI